MIHAHWYEAALVGAALFVTGWLIGRLRFVEWRAKASRVVLDKARESAL